MPGDELHQPHDKLFTAGFSDPANAAGFLRAELPEAISALIDWSSLQLEPGKFVDSHFRHSESDLLFSATLSGRECLIYLLFEHQSTLDAWLALRLLRYMVRIWEAHRKARPDATKLPVILPVVLTQNAEVWKMEHRFAALLDLPEDLAGAFQLYVPEFEFRICQLAQMSFESIRGTPAGILILRTMKAQRLAQLLNDAVWDEALILQISRETFELLLRYILAADIDKVGFERKIRNITNAQARSNAMSLAEQYHQEGLEKGLQTGRQEGIWIGRIQVLEELMAEPVSDRSELSDRSESELMERYRGLQQRYNDRFKNRE